MAKKVKPESVYVKCRNCKNASDFGDNSAYCKVKDIECVPVTDMGKFATVFKKIITRKRNHECIITV